MGGVLILTTVDIDSTIPFRYKPPAHLTYWTKEALEFAGEIANFRMRNCEQYFMFQDKTVYMNILLRTVPDHYKQYIDFVNMPDLVKIPTNEVLVVFEKNEF